DTDGLADWQEIIYKTDSCRPDTDGDGYLDGEEVLSGYAPTIAAPNDAMESAQERGLPQNLTNILAENVAKQIIEGKLGNISDALDSTAIQTSNQVVNDAINQTIAQAMNEFSLPNISDDEIAISSDNSGDAIESYAGKIVQIMSDWEEKTSTQPSQTPQTEGEIFYNAISTRDFGQVSQYAQYYAGVSEDLKKIPVPSTLKEIHKKQIGIFKVTANIYQAIKEIDQDPLKTTLAIEQYGAAVELTKQMFFELANKLE
ncbi:MAG TPA: hypothetical protein VJB62_00715, partial [Patescibacteria group bacterium]|nr:hypothetical protein [Patescibacteria group bacterium]